MCVCVWGGGGGEGSTELSFFSHSDDRAVDRDVSHLYLFFVSTSVTTPGSWNCIKELCCRLKTSCFTGRINRPKTKQQLHI